jgi:hypothetical protein
MLDFPANPTTNQLYTAGGQQWIWDGTKWAASGVGVGYVPVSGGTMTGPLILSGDATVDLGAATREQAHARMPGSNRIINGDMRIDQRNNGATGTTFTYTCDRWAYASAAVLGTWQRQSSVAMAPNGFPYCLGFTSNSAHVSAAGDSIFFYQSIEADMVSDFAWGTPNAQPVTLSFWFNAPVAGTYSGAITNNPAPPTRCYPFSFTASVAGWIKVIINIPGDTGGTWVMSGNAAGVNVRFDLGSGSTYRAAAGVWVSGNYNGVTGTVQVVATNGQTIQFTGVKLESGNIATPYNRESLAKGLADCQRYFQLVSGSARGYANIANAQLDSTLNFLPMRTAPTVTSFALPSNGNVTTYVIISITYNGARLEITATAAGDTFSVGGQYAMNAEL